MDRLSSDQGSHSLSSFVVVSFFSFCDCSETKHFTVYHDVRNVNRQNLYNFLNIVSTGIKAFCKILAPVVQRVDNFSQWIHVSSYHLTNTFDQIFVPHISL